MILAPRFGFFTCHSVAQWNRDTCHVLLGARDAEGKRERDKLKTVPPQWNALATMHHHAWTDILHRPWQASGDWGIKAMSGDVSVTFAWKSNDNYVKLSGLTYTIEWDRKKNAGILWQGNAKVNWSILIIRHVVHTHISGNKRTSKSQRSVRPGQGYYPFGATWDSPRQMPMPASKWAYDWGPNKRTNLLLRHQLGSTEIVKSLQIPLKFTAAIVQLYKEVP